MKICISINYTYFNIFFLLQIHPLVPLSVNLNIIDTREMGNRSVSTVSISALYTGWSASSDEFLLSKQRGSRGNGSREEHRTHFTELLFVLSSYRGWISSGFESIRLPISVQTSRFVFVYPFGMNFLAGYHVNRSCIGSLPRRIAIR